MLDKLETLFIGCYVLKRIIPLLPFDPPSAVGDTAPTKQQPDLQPTALHDMPQQCEQQQPRGRDLPKSMSPATAINSSHITIELKEATHSARERATETVVVVVVVVGRPRRRQECLEHIPIVRFIIIIVD